MSGELLEQLYAQSNENYTIPSSRHLIRTVLQNVSELALDFETTALVPYEGTIRITSICSPEMHLVIDHFLLAMPFSELIPLLRGKTIYVYNAKFEQHWIDEAAFEAGIEPIDVIDVDFLAKSVIGGGFSSLAVMCKRDLGIDLPKDEQRSDWSLEGLTQSQYNYAAFDSFITWRLVEHWKPQLNDGHWNGVNILNGAVRGTIECEETGLYLNANYHKKVVETWQRKFRTFERYFKKFTPDINFRSGKQLDEFFRQNVDEAVLKHWPRTEKKKMLQFEGKYLRAQARHFPYPFSRWMAALAGMKYFDKYISTYGEKLIWKQARRGKITTRFNMAQAITCRYSSSDDNLQNIPRKVYVRKAFTIPPSPLRGDKFIRHIPARVALKMLLADYSGIEIRTLGEVSGDEQLIEDVIERDVHAASCAQIFNHDIDWVMDVLASKGEGRYGNAYPMIKEQRSVAKGFTFQLTYGAAAGALSNVLRCSYDEAEEAIMKWADRYPKAYHYRTLMFEEMSNTGYLPVISGRTIFVPKLERSIPVAANYPIQGAAADVMYRAIYHTHKAFSDNDLPAYLAATVHDELLAYCQEEFAEEAMGLQLEAMEKGWLDIFPGTSTKKLLDWAIGTNWGDKP